MFFMMALSVLEGFMSDLKDNEISLDIDIK